MNPSIRVYPSNSSGSMDFLPHPRKHGKDGDHSRSSPLSSPRTHSSSNVNSSLNVNSPVEGARWSEHQNLRKPKFYMNLSEDQELNAYRSFAQSHFHKLECEWFVPRQKQADVVKTVRDLRCHCGETLENHEAMRERATLAAKLKPNINIVPKELNELVANLNNPAPKVLPDLPWSKEQCLKREITDGYGKIRFNLEMIGGMKPAKYIRLAHTDSVDDLLDCMKQYWRIMEPEPPTLVISVVGGAKNFKLDGRNRDIFHSGLIKAAKTTSAWLITSGFNMGVMKAVGQAVHEGQTFAWNNDRMTHKLRCIALAPWGYVENRASFCRADGKGCFPAKYTPSNLIQHGFPVSINPDHTHFVFVDDGMRNGYTGVAEFRASFERKISLPTNSSEPEEGGLGIPVVLVVVEGGTDAIRTVSGSIEQGIPVVLCAGTGRAADILSYAYSHTITTRSGERFMQKKHMEILATKLFMAYGKGWSEDNAQAELDKYQKLALECCEKEDMITIFHMQKHEDLDLAILKALLKAKGSESLAQRQNQLKLALTWNRSDIAQEEIFREDVFWPRGSLDDIMTDALLHDRVEFVQLLIQQGFAMKGYLTKTRLEHLYNSDVIPQFCHLRQLLKRMKNSEGHTLPDVKKLLKQLLDTFDDSEYSSSDMDTVVGYDEMKTSVEFTRPYKELFLWAVLMKRQDLAKLCWEMGEESVATAIVASRLYLSLSKCVAQHESVLRQVYLDHKEEFEMLATSVLNECHSLDPDKAMMLVEKPSPSWSGVTCLQLAAAAHDQIFLSSATCQNSINLTWKRGLLCSWKRVLAAILCPFLIWPFIKMESMGDKKIGILEKGLLFYKAPITKYAANSIMYLVFLCLYSYMVLFDFKSYTSVTEWICIMWIFSFLVDEVHCLLVFPSPTITGKLRDWYGFLNRIDLANLILVFIGFTLKQFPPPYLGYAKTIYCLNCVSFFLRIMKLYKANSFLGPKLYMIVRMIEELLLFVSILVVFLLAYGVSSQSLLWPNRAPYWGVLKDIFYYPYWQIYGEVFLEEFESDTACINQYANSSLYANADVPCRTFSSLVPILLAAYLLIGNVLLLNLLIAIFSHVFDEVQKNTLEIWKYQIYFLVMEYDVKTFLVPPFSLLEHIYKLIRYLFRHTCCKKKHPRAQYLMRHLQYLQLFEKEMMANYLRWKKAEEMNSIDNKFHKIQKRVDEMTKLIEDEVIADQQHFALMQQASFISGSPTQGNDRGDGTLSVGDQDTTKWPMAEEVVDLEKGKGGEEAHKSLEEIAEQRIREQRKEKKKKKKKHKHRREKHDHRSGDGGESTDPEHSMINYYSPDISRLQNVNQLSDMLPQRPGLRHRYSNLSMRTMRSEDTDIVARPRQLRRQLSREMGMMQDADTYPTIWSDDDIDFNDMVPLKFSKNQKK